MKNIQNPEDTLQKLDVELIGKKVPKGVVEILIYIHIPPKF